MTDLTVGKPWTVLWKFSLPMFVSVIFQQMYSIFDSIIAGKFAGEDALAAVGASYPITMIFMAFAVGSNVGCCVVISQFFGGKEFSKVKTASTTTIISCTILATVLTVFGLAFSTPLMRMINTPDNIFRDGELYLKIYIAGLIFLFLYNVGTGIYNAMGDSKTPLYLLIGSSVGNVVLDYVFVKFFKWGVAGVAWATFIAQGVACVFSLLILVKKTAEIKTEDKPPLFSGKILKKITLYSIPSILQQSFISVGNIFVQYLVNSFGSSCIAGYSSAIKLNTFAITSFTTLSNGLSSFVAQNYGAGLIQRMNKCLLSGIGFALIFGLSVCLYSQFLPETLTAFFTKDPAVVTMAAEYLRGYSIDCVVVSFVFCINSYFSGQGNSLFPMIHSLIATLLFRIPLSHWFSQIDSSSLFIMGFAPPISTVVSLFICIWYLRYTRKRNY